MAVDIEVFKGQALRAVKAFSPAQLVIAGLLGVVAIVAGMTFFSWVSAPSYTVLYSGLSAKDAAAVTTKLQSSGVPFKLTGGGTTILVPSDKVDAERVALAAAGTVKGGVSGYELLDKQGLTTSSFTQQIDLQRAMEGELDRTLATISGINSAQVHLVLPQERLFADQQRPARASVLLDTNGQLSHDQVQSVISLVSSSVPDLDPSAVTVTDSNGDLLSTNAGDSTATTQLQQQQAYEDTMSASAQSMLDRLLGVGHAVVRVSANLDFSKHSTDSVTYGSTPAPALTTNRQTETYGGGAGVGTATGPLTVTNTTAATASANPAGTAYSKTSDQSTYGVNQTNDHSDNAGGNVQRLTVAVAVDSSTPNLPPAAQLQTLVAAAVGLNPARGDSIVVTSTPFDKTAATTTTGKGGKGSTSLGGSAAASSGGMMKTVSTGVAGLMLLVITFFVARAVRRPKITELDLGGYPSLPSGSVPLQRLPGGARAALPPGPAQVSGQAGAVDLLDAVEQTPDDVAKLLRGWLADSGTQR